MPFLPLLLGLAPTVASWIMGDRTGAAIAKVSGIARRSWVRPTLPASSGPSQAIRPRPAVQDGGDPSRGRCPPDGVRHAAGDACRRGERPQPDRRTRQGRFGHRLGRRRVSLLVTAAFMAALWFVVRQEIPAASREIAYILLGTLGAKFGDIVAYWVGSSSGSAQKSAALEKAVVTGGGR